MKDKIEELLTLRTKWIVKRETSPQEEAERINAEYDAEFKKISRTLTRKEKDKYWEKVCNLYKR